MKEPSPLRYFGVTPDSREEQILRLLIHAVVEGVGGDEGSLLVLDPSGDLRFAMTAGDSASEQALIGQRVPIGQGITGLAAQTRDVQIGAPTFRDVRQTEGKSEGPEAVLAAPMLIDDRLVGVVTAVSFTEGKRFDAHSAMLAGRLASVAAVVVEQTMQTAAMGAGRSQALEVHQLVDRIAEGAPEQLVQVASILSSFGAALGLRTR